MRSIAFPVKGKSFTSCGDFCNLGVDIEADGTTKLDLVVVLCDLTITSFRKGG